jgi:hypothetical protein
MLARQGTDGSAGQSLGATDRIRLNGTGFSDSLAIGVFQDS